MNDSQQIFITRTTNPYKIEAFNSSWEQLKVGSNYFNSLNSEVSELKEKEINYLAGEESFVIKKAVRERNAGRIAKARGA